MPSSKSPAELRQQYTDLQNEYDTAEGQVKAWKAKAVALFAKKQAVKKELRKAEQDQPTPEPVEAK